MHNTTRIMHNIIREYIITSIMHTLARVCVCAYNILLSTRVLVCERITPMHIMDTSVLVIIVGASQSRNKVEQYQDKEPLVLTHHHATSFLRIITTLE